MSREIKFRAWDKKKSKMFNDVIVTNNMFYVPKNLLVDFSNTYAMVNCILMQYTGLNDKNGTEIYEGDILQEVVPNYDACSCDGCTCEQNYYHNNEVKFDTLKGFYMDLNHYIKEEDFTRREIIGNIHENPELIKKGKELKIK